MATKKAGTKEKPAAADTSKSKGAVLARLRDIEQTARHAADPREPASQLAKAMADYIEGK